MARRLAVLLVALSMGATLLVACGDDDSGDAGDAGGGGGEMCDLFRRINALDDRSQAAVDENIGKVLQAGTEAEAEAAFQGFVDTFGPFAEEELPAVLDLYDELADEVPEARRDDVVVLRDFTADFLEDLQGASSPQQLVQIVQAARGGAQAAGAATVRLDEVSRAECDLVFAD